MIRIPGVSRLAVRRWRLAATAAVVPLVAAGWLGAPLWAGDHAGHGAQPAAEQKEAVGLLIDLGNTKCPGPMGGKPDGRTFSEWNGLRIGHCCGMCPAKFMAAPERSLKQAKVEWAEAAAAVKKVNDAKGAARAKAREELKKKWTVVREPAPEVLGTLVDLANTKCPVKGGDVDGKSFGEWSGLRVNYCCEGCDEKFQANAAKLLDAAKIAWKPIAEAVKAVDAAKGADRAKALETLKKKYTVLRDPPTETAK
jgi:hypothetical protein